MSRSRPCWQCSWSLTMHNWTTASALGWAQGFAPHCLRADASQNNKPTWKLQLSCGWRSLTACKAAATHAEPTCAAHSAAPNKQQQCMCCQQWRHSVYSACTAQRASYGAAADGIAAEPKLQLSQVRAWTSMRDVEAQTDPPAVPAMGQYHCCSYDLLHGPSK